MSNIGKYEERLYAEMSAFAYEDVDKIDGAHNISYDAPVSVADLGGPEYLEGWSVAEVINDNNNSGVYAVVFVNEESKDAVIAFRGSEQPWRLDFSVNDYVTDWLIADLMLLNNEETEYQEALREIMADPERIEYLKEYNCIDFTGHSLGSNSAIVEFNEWFHSGDEELVSKLGDCVVFDGPGGSNEFIEANPELADCEGRIVQYNWSLVGNFFRKLPGVTYIDVEVKWLHGALIASHPVENLKFDENGNVIEGEAGIFSMIPSCKLIAECMDEAPDVYGQVAIVLLNDIIMRVMVTKEGLFPINGYSYKASCLASIMIIFWSEFLLLSVVEVVVIVACVLQSLIYVFGEEILTRIENELLKAKVFTEEQFNKIWAEIKSMLSEEIPYEKILEIIAGVSAEIIVDTVKAELYRERLQRIKSQISSLSGQLGGISSHYGLLDLGGLLNGAFLTRHLWKIDANIAYLNSVIDSFESAENRLKVLTT